MASGSPRRAELLKSVGVSCSVRPTDVDETAKADEAPLLMVERLAISKARTDARSGELRLAADTIVIYQNQALGKPTSSGAAQKMLETLSDQTHQVATGVALLDVDSGRMESTVVVTEVSFFPIGTQEIADYIATGEPLDKAGAYGIQGRAALFVRAIRGCYSNVVGLPLAHTNQLFQKLGHDLRVLAAAGESRSNLETETLSPRT